jgi:pimeloyl-ACP methyl ester carboxylesterase
MDAGVLGLIAAVALSSCYTHTVGPEDILRGARRSERANRPYNVEVAAGDGVILRGWSVTRPAHRLSAIYFGGNGETVDEHHPIFALAEQHRFDVYGVNYRGFGPSDGPARLDAIAADALSVFDAIRANESGTGRHSAVVVGFSFGSAPALHVATQRVVAGVVLQAPPTSAAEAIPRLPLPWYWAWLVRLRADPELGAWPQPIDMVAGVSAPLLVIHGDRDRVVPIDLGVRVFSSARSIHKTFCRVPGAGHGDLWVLGADTPRRCLDAFLRQLTAATAEV